MGGCLSKVVSCPATQINGTLKVSIFAHFLHKLLIINLYCHNCAMTSLALNEISWLPWFPSEGFSDLWRQRKTLSFSIDTKHQETDSDNML